MKRNKAMKKNKQKRGTYGEKFKFLMRRSKTFRAEFGRRCFGFDFPEGEKPWK